MAMAWNQYRQHLDILGMSQRGAGRFLKISERSSRRFAAKGGDPIPRPIELLLRVMRVHGLTPEQVYDLAGLKIPDEGFGDARANGVAEMKTAPAGAASRLPKARAKAKRAARPRGRGHR